jgi:hypothetical protein
MRKAGLAKRSGVFEHGTVEAPEPKDKSRRYPDALFHYQHAHAMHMYRFGVSDKSEVNGPSIFFST